MKEQLELKHILNVFENNGRVIKDGKEREILSVSKVRFSLLGEFGYEYFGKTQCKILSRPLSQLTELIEHKGERFVPIERIGIDAFEGGAFENGKFSWNNDFFNTTDVFTIEHYDGELGFMVRDDNGRADYLTVIPYKYQEWLNEWHFDWRYNLIEKGLAEPIKQIT